jgi:hypothetical protein
VERATALRAGVALFTAATFVGSGSYVVANPKNEAAPLQPPVEAPLALRTPVPSASALPARSARATPPPRITLAPGVQATVLPGITFTHVS